ncbi:MAG: hypothetical protein VX737_01690 [Pseudomonadota bacterium]|nr:hypothetical protein [Pseudomonadota bacterium]
MNRAVILTSIIACIILAILISLAPDQNSIYEELGSRTGRLIDTVLKTLAILSLLKYLFSEAPKR